MQLAIQKAGITALGIALTFASLSVALAQEVSAEANVSAQVNLGAQGQRPRPLQLLHDTRMQLKANAGEELGGLKTDAKNFRMETRAEFKNASSGPERQGIRMEARAELKTNLKERMQVLFRTHLGSAIARFNAAIQHFENIVTRIESRIEKLKERGVNTASVEAELDLAVEAIGVAKVDVQALSSIGTSLSALSTVAEAKAAMRVALQKATASIKAAHKTLLETARELSTLVRASASTEINSGASVDTGN